jgi:hypothetical protein
MSLSRIGHSLQHAAILAVTLLFAFASLTLAAAGGNFILGVANNSGTSQTGLITNTTAPFHAFVVQQNGNGNGGYFVSVNGSGMLGITKSGNKYAMSGTNDGAAGTGGAIIGLGKNNVGLVATSDGDNAIVADAADTSAIVATGHCSGFLCGAAGVVGNGEGLSGGVNGFGPLGVAGTDSTGGDGFGLFTQDDAFVGGDLDISGTCTGCTTALAAVNGSGTALQRGDAVTVLGVETDANGSLVLSVGPAAAGQMVVGIVDVATTEVQSGTADSPRRAYKAGGSNVAAGGTLRVVTSGIVAFAAADASAGAIAVGDSLAASATAGNLAKAGPSVAIGSRIGYALGTLADGRIVMFVDPH